MATNRPIPTRSSARTLACIVAVLIGCHCIALSSHAQGIWSGGAGGTQSVTDFAQGAAITGGAVDSKPAFDRACAAIAARGGGRLRVPKGQYLYNSSSSFSDTETFCGEISNILMFGDGPDTSVINFSGSKGVYLGLGRADINRICTSPPNTGCTIPPYGLPAYYLIGNVSTGSQVTTSTAADAGNFTTGGWVFIESGDASPGTGHPPKHFEYNQVVSSNASTGVVVLKYPLSDAYDSSQSPYVPMMAQITVPNNIVIRDMGFTSNHASSVILGFNGTANVTIDNCKFTAVSGGASDVWNGYSWHGTVQNSKFYGTIADLGDAGGYWSYLNNTLSSTSTFTGSGASREWTFDGNLITDSTLFIGGSSTYQFRGLRITNNLIQLSSTDGFPTGISVFYSNYPIIRGNTFIGVVAGGNEGSCITLGAGAVSGDVGGNVCTLATELKYGIHAVSGATGNSIHDNQTAGNTYGVTLSSGSTGTVMGCNNFVGSTNTDIDDGNTTTVYTCAPGKGLPLSQIPSGYTGQIRMITDSSTTTWGASVTGLSSHCVLGVWTGSNWSVMGKCE